MVYVPVESPAIVHTPIEFDVAVKDVFSIAIATPLLSFIRLPEQDGETTSEIYFTISCIGAIIGGLGLILSELAGH